MASAACAVTSASCSKFVPDRWHKKVGVGEAKRKSLHPRTLGPNPASPSATTDFDSAARSTSSSVFSPNTLTTTGTSGSAAAPLLPPPRRPPQQPRGWGGSAVAAADDAAAAAAADGLGPTLTRMFEMPPEILVNWWLNNGRQGF
jgi:hypothetical protein